MKKILLLIATILTFSLVLGVGWHVKAGGVSATLTLQALNASAPADGHSTITFKAYATYNGSPVPYDTIWITVAGSGYTLGGVTTVANSPYVQSGNDGYAQFTMVDNTPGNVTVTVDGGDNKPSATVSFTTPVATTPAPTPTQTTTPTKTTTPTPTPTVSTTPAPAPTAPAAPTTDFKLNNQTVGNSTVPTVPANKAFVLSGKTVPDGVVTLYIFSTPRQATVTADANGNWTYQVTGLESGSHHVEGTVTDPATKLTSDRVTLAKFTIARPTATVAATPIKKSASPVWIIVGAGIVAILITGLVFWLLRRRRHNKVMPPADSADITTPTEPQQPA